MAFRVITAVYPDARRVIRTAEVEECGKRSLRPISYLVPLELDCRHDDDALRLCPRDPQGNEEDDADDDEEDDAIITDVDSIPDVNQRGSVGAEGQLFLLDVSYVETIPAESQRGSNVSADAEGQRFLPDVSYTHMSGSSRESGLANGTTDGCYATKATPTTVPQSLTPTTVVTQTQEGEERDGGEAMTTA